MNDQTFIILLRGVMPTGKNKVRMEDLRSVLTEAGLRQVRTWIQSGNVLVTTALPREEVITLVHDTIQQSLGPDLSVIVKTADEIQRVLDENPFIDEAQDRIFYALMNEPVQRKIAEELQAMDFGEEKLAFTEHAIYLFIPGSAARSKLNGSFLERKLKVRVTVRNRNTLRKVVEMAEDLQ